MNRHINKILVGTLLITASFSNLFAQTASPQYLNEIKALVENTKIKNAFKHILDNDAQRMKDLVILTETPAPPFNEKERAELFAKYLRDLGLTDVIIDEVGNVVARRPGKSGNKTVAFNAHLDTVFPVGTDVTVKTDGDTLRAPGIGDDTAGLALVLAVVRTLQEQNIETDADILIIASVGEEGLGDLRGVKHIFKDDRHGIDSWIAIDGGTIGRIVNKGLGSHRYKVTFKGPGGHSWGAFGLGNPAHAMGRAITLFTDAADKYTAPGTGPKTSYNVGRMGGGTSVNSVPFEAWMEIDMRSQTPERLNGVDAILQEAIQTALKEQNKLNRRGPKLTVDVKMVGNRPSGALSDDIPLTQRAIAATAHFGKKAVLQRSSTDTNIPVSKGIPGITIGRGGASGGAHSLSEWYVNKDGHLAVQNAFLILMAESGLITNH